MKRYIDKLHQREWDECTGNNLNKVQTLLGDCRFPGHLIRQEEIAISCLCVGHTQHTHPYQMNSEDVPGCVACDCAHTVEHILIECGD